MSKTKLDLLHGSLWDKIPQFALPVAATVILEQLFNASDVAVVGNFTGSNSTVAVAAVGANSPIIYLILNLFIGIALGANVVIATAIGRNDKDTVKRAVHTAILMAIAGGVLVALLGEAVAGPLLGMLNVPDDVFPFALLYLRIYLLGLPVIFLYNFEAAVFRSVGDTKTPLMALTFSGILNFLLNLFFVIVLKMTVNGVAIATVISNAVSSLFLLYRLIHTDAAIHVSRHDLHFDNTSFCKIIQIGLPAGVQSAVFSLANIIIQATINSLGTVVIAASSAAFNIEVVAYYTFNSFSQACTTFVGQNYGARQLDRCRRIFVVCLLEDVLVTVAVMGVILYFGDLLLALFNPDPEVIALGYTRLSTIFFGYIFSLLYELMSGYLRGFGISLAPAVLTTLGVCGTRIFWVQAVFPKHPDFQNLMLVYPLSLFVTAILILGTLLVYRPTSRIKKQKENVA